MGYQKTIYFSEPSMAILNELNGDSVSDKVRLALEQADGDISATLMRQERLIEALRKQIAIRNGLLKRVLIQGRIKNVLRDHILDLGLE
jgi:hypothetical protein